MLVSVGVAIGRRCRLGLIGFQPFRPASEIGVTLPDVVTLRDDPAEADIPPRLVVASRLHPPDSAGVYAYLPCSGGFADQDQRHGRQENGPESVPWKP